MNRHWAPAQREALFARRALRGPRISRAAVLEDVEANLAAVAQDPQVAAMHVAGLARVEAELAITRGLLVQEDALLGHVD